MPLVPKMQIYASMYMSRGSEVDIVALQPSLNASPKAACER